MSKQSRRKWRPVYDAALRLIELLSDTCHQIEMVGSLRRREPTVGEIDLLAEPMGSTDLFGDPTGSAKLDARLVRLNAEGKIRGISGGNIKKTFLFEGINVDLTLKAAAAWGVSMAIQTGPAEFSRRLVTEETRGGFLPQFCRVEVGTGKVFRGSFRHHETGNVIEPGTVVDTIETERDFLEFCSCGWVEPDQRFEFLATRGKK